MAPVLFLLPLLLPLAAGAVVDPWKQLVTSFSSGTELYYPASPDWKNITSRWVDWDAPEFASAIIPETQEDIQSIVKFATQYDVPFLATRSRHGYSGTLGKLQNGIHLDLRRFDKIEVDAEANRMTIGGGVLFEDIFDPLYNAGKELQTGACPCVSVLGPTLGGGLARYEGLHGLIADALLEAKVLTGRGDIVTASRTKNADLFWGLQGAGFQFGIVLEAVYEIYDLTNKGQIINADYLFEPKVNESFYQQMKEISTTIPAELSLLSLIYYDMTRNSTMIMLNAVYVGTLEKSNELLKPFLDIGYVQSNVSETQWNIMPYLAGFSAQGPLCQKDKVRSLFSAGLKEIDVSNMVSIFNQFYDFHKQYPDAWQSSYELGIYGPQAVQKIPDDATAYPHRDINLHTLPSFQWVDRSIDEPVNAFGKKIRDQTAEYSGFDKLRLYVNYGHGDEEPESLYGAHKLPKLRLLKKKYDPNGLFSHFNPF